jgi:D-alanyl-D-alanine carboxypeptidase
MTPLIKGLQEHHITRIEGPINFVPKDSRLDERSYPAGVVASDVLTYTGAPDQSFNWLANSALLYFTYGEGDRYTWEDPFAQFAFKLDFHLTPGSNNHAAQTPIATRDASGNYIVLSEGAKITGTYAECRPVNGKRQVCGETHEFAMQRPKNAFANAVFAYLKANGINVDRASINLVSTSYVPSAYPPYQAPYAFALRPTIPADSMVSSPLAKPGSSATVTWLASTMLVYSTCLIADALEKRMLVKYTNVTSMIRNYAKAFYSEKIASWFRNEGVDTTKMFDINEGVGLSKENLVTPRGFMMLLQKIQKNPTLFHWITAGMPVAAEKGTLNTGQDGSVTFRFGKTFACLDGVTIYGKTVYFPSFQA